MVSLALAEGANRSELARRFGVSRKTLYKWLEAAQRGEDLSDRSRRPKRSPRRSSEALESEVLALREEKRGWGGRKIARRLRETRGLLVSPSTVTEILRRHDALDGPRAGRKRDWRRFEREAPNELWQMDFKGHFPTLLDGRCHPFDALDDHSRYCLSLRACGNEGWLTVRECLTEAFRRYGLPLQILCDNGGCWGSTSAREVTPLTVWLSRLGVQVIHGRAYHPQTQGKLELFHRTLRRELLQFHQFRDLTHCQREFARYRDEYNRERPHDALGLETPARIYRASALSFPEGALPEPEYAEGAILRKVQAGGVVHFRGGAYRAGKCLAGLTVEIRPVQSEDGLYDVRYGRTRIERIDLRERDADRD